MQNKLIATFLAVVCLGLTTPALAQTPQKENETPQEKIMRLEIENKVRQELMDSLARRVATLEAKLKESKQQVAAQKAAAAKKNTAPTLKPYYATLEIQQKCEKYPKCAKWAKQTYNYQKNKNRPWQITNVKEHQYFVEPGWFDRVGETVYEMRLYVNGSSSEFKARTFRRTGLGKNPLSWEENILLSLF